jgi:hypothetical protein
MRQSVFHSWVMFNHRLYVSNMCNGEAANPRPLARPLARPRKVCG